MIVVDHVTNIFYVLYLQKLPLSVKSQNLLNESLDCLTTRDPAVGPYSEQILYAGPSLWESSKLSSWKHLLSCALMAF